MPTLFGSDDGSHIAKYGKRAKEPKTIELKRNGHAGSQLPLRDDGIISAA